ncbi:MAG TPA: adenosylmethionine--8-amino-7-oxononanoate transaminase [Puia sp.]|nr:adenosylmethionine--8-amino-7-oxononanoate transaminase [Puia sp.]
MGLTERDQRVIWHPYTQHQNMMPPVAVLRGEGALLFDENNRAYIDSISSWWVNIHGHAHPYIAQKIYEQAKCLEHVIFTGFTHEPAVRLAERLLPILPGPFSRVFYSDNGSTAVEVAIKMAIQYHRNLSRDPHPPSTLLAFRNAYHGDTFGAMSVSERGTFTAAFRDYLFDVQFIDTPNASNISELKNFISSRACNISAFIYEPLLQAAGGMHMYQPGPMNDLLAHLQSNGILCIADEVMTGFGRTGKTFASSWLSAQPDIICLSKGLTGGTMALGVTACTPQIFDAFLSEDKTRTFFHGHSFTANPIACAAALASLDLLEQADCAAGIDRILDGHGKFARTLSAPSLKLPVKNIRQLGTVIAFELEAGADGYLNQAAHSLTRDALESGIYIRPLGNTIYLMPPYCITGQQLEQVYDFLLTWLQQKTGKP